MCPSLPSSSSSSASWLSCSRWSVADGACAAAWLPCEGDSGSLQHGSCLLEISLHYIAGFEEVYGLLMMPLDSVVFTWSLSRNAAEMLPLFKRAG
ncbi:hypothetical protein Droror1_Dr00018216 [Drosera rotundifolia]